jgi:SAM-dependent methyltransferase
LSYDRSAFVYDAIYQVSKAYRQETDRLHELIEQVGQSGGNRLLDVACGSGLHDQYLTRWYEVEGLDASEAMLSLARRRVPEAVFHVGDMTGFDLGKRFDVVTCLFSSIGHLTTVEDLEQAVANMVRHLKPGGILVVEPWLHPGRFQEGRIGTDFADLPELKVARITLTTLEGRLTTLNMHHLVGRPDGVEYFVEHHVLALYTEDEYLSSFRAAGLQAWHEQEGLMGRGLFIGRRPGE